MKVVISFKEGPAPVKYEHAEKCYVEGGMFCIKVKFGRITKENEDKVLISEYTHMYPVESIFRVESGYEEKIIDLPKTDGNDEDDEDEDDEGKE